MLPSKSSKRLRSSKSSAEEPTPDNAFIPPAKRNTRSRSAPSQTQPRDNLDQESQQRFTRRRAKTLGKEPISGEEEPERYLRRKAKQQAQAAAKEPEKNSPEMDRGGQPRVSALLQCAVHESPK